MKLLNQSIKHISISLFAIIVLWGVVFFFNMTAEIKQNVDEGLSNYKRQIIYQANRDSTLLSRIDFDDGFYTIREIDKEKAFSIKDHYTDTIIRIQNLGEVDSKLDPVRMLTTAFEDKDRYYQLKIINPMVEKDDLVHRLLLNMIWLYAALIITILVINNFVLQRLWKPFYELLHKLQSYRLGSGGKPPSIKTKTKEFKDLEEAVQTLLDHNIKIYDQQKQFIGNASHELQTPLAIAITKLELLLEEEKLDGLQANKLVEILEIIERLVRLNKSLLLLTKIENKQFLNTQNVEINSIVRRGIDELQELSEFKNIEISLNENTRIFKTMDPSLTEIMISNLLKNAIFHNRSNSGKVEIILDKNILSICNTGVDKPLEGTQIFKRFYKSPSEKENTGLGLAIIKAITDLYKIRIFYEFKNQKHCFELHF